MINNKFAALCVSTLLAVSSFNVFAGGDSAVDKAKAAVETAAEDVKDAVMPSDEAMKACEGKEESAACEFMEKDKKTEGKCHKGKDEKMSCQAK